jgi:flagellar FliL protein
MSKQKAIAKEDPAAAEEGAPAPPAPKGGARRLVVMAAPVVLIFLLGAGAWAAGLLPFGHKPASHAEAAAAPIYVDLPEMIANLDSDPRRPRYIKLRARIEVHGVADEQAIKASMPRLQDLFQTYLRDMRPDDLRGSMGTYRLREELIARADVAAAPAKIDDVLFVEMIVQ